MKLKIKHKDLNPNILSRIGYVGVVAGNIEHFLEDTILNITKEPVVGVYPSTDGKAVSKLITKLESLIHLLPSDQLRRIAKTWCEAASDGFICRNVIFHGRSFVYDVDSLNFITNTGYKEELRKRSSRDFIASPQSTKMLSDSFEILEFTITGFMLYTEDKITEEQLLKQSIEKRLFAARSELRELANLVDLYNDEKY